MGAGNRFHEMLSDVPVVKIANNRNTLSLGGPNPKSDPFFIQVGTKIAVTEKTPVNG